MRRDCAWTREYIDTYLDGELGAEDSRRLAAHTAACAACARELELARLCRRELRSLPSLAPSPRLVDAAEREAARAAAPVVVPFAPRRTRPGGRWVVAAAVVLAAALGAWWASRPRPDRVASARERAEVEQASREASIAFAYVAKYSRRTEELVRDDVIGMRVVLPVHRALAATREATVDDAVIPGIKRALDESGLGATSKPHERS